MPELVDWHQGTLRAARALTADIRLLELAVPAGLAAASPGSHLQVLIPVDGRMETRSYSVVRAGADGTLHIAVKLLADTRGGSAYMWRLAPGARITLSAPRNRFGLRLDRPDYLLVAGGIGITPILGMALALAAAGARIRVLYGVRGAQDAAFADELGAAIGGRLELVAGGAIDLAGAIGRLLPGGEAYVCGPIGMLEAARHAWRASGRPMDLLRFETFGSSGQHPTEAFVVHLPRLGMSVEVPRHVTLLDALERAGVAMIHDCRRGECGVCALPILGVDGIVDHRDVFFSEEERAGNAKLCTCVSRVAGGSIRLDVGLRQATPAGRAAVMQGG